ncbi:nucleotide exchange factor GrpE [Candidatus Peregrinibacteria bacterium RIFOXYB2_FULL_32_7]|nr:MAG: nucleotide exchange factor GrpE [Candidatus Peregrinibacteria bacterium RIFOXYB2_FULL_32_7]
MQNINPQSNQSQQDQNQPTDQNQPQSLEDKIKSAEEQDDAKKAQAQKKDEEDKDKIIENLKKELEEMKVIAQRAVADYQNLRRRSEEEKTEFAKYANSQLILELLPFLDNFKLAIFHLPEDLKNNEWVCGILHIEKQFLSALEKIGIKKIETLNRKFDTNFHSALMQIPGEKDVIMEEAEAGYMLNNKVIRYAKVIVGNGNHIETKESEK